MELLRFRKKRRKLKKGVLAIILAFLAAAVGILFWVVYAGGAEGSAKVGQIRTVFGADAVIVRRETIETTEEFDYADYFAADGQLVEAGETVMNVYKMGYSREITLSLWRARQDVYEAQMAQLGEARDVELRSLDDRIESARERLSNAVMSGDTAAVLPIQNELTGLLEQRSEYLRGYCQENETLRGLYNKESDWERAVEDSRIPLTARTSGRVSYYFDDYAVALNADKLRTVTSDLVSSALRRSQPAKWTGGSRTSAFRIVDPSEWYIVFLTDANSALRLAEGMRYPVEIAGYGTFEGIALESYVNGKKIINILKISEDMGELINVRAVRVSITCDATGIRVEKRAIQFEKGEPYIEIITSEGRMGVYVDVLAEDGDYAVIRAKNTDSTPIGVGVKYWIPKRR